MIGAVQSDILEALASLAEGATIPTLMLLTRRDGSRCIRHAMRRLLAHGYVVRDGTIPGRAHAHGRGPPATVYFITARGHLAMYLCSRPPADGHAP